MSKSSRYSKEVQEKEAALLAAANLSSASKKLEPDAPSCIQGAILDAYKKSQKLEKESKGVGGANTAASAGSVASATANIVGGGSTGRTTNLTSNLHHQHHQKTTTAINTANKAVGFNDPEATGRTEARLGLRDADVDLNSGSSIQPWQYPKLFSHSGFSPAAEEVHKNSAILSEQLRSMSSSSSQKKKNRKRSSSSSSRTSSSDGSSSSRPSSAEERKLAARRRELDDTILHNTVLCSDAGFLSPLVDQCMNLRTPTSEDHTPPTIQARFDQVDDHALVTVGACAQLKNLEGLQQVIAKLVQPYRGSHSWKLSHLEAELCRVRVIYRWITSFIKLDSPPTPPSLTPQTMPSILQEKSSSSSSTQQANTNVTGGGTTTAQESGSNQPPHHPSAVASGTKSHKSSKKVVVSAPTQSAGTNFAEQFSSYHQQQQFVKDLQSLTVPKWFPYKYQDCDDPEDASFLRNELPENEIQNILGGENNKDSSSTSSPFVIGEETSTSVFNTRTGDCHMIATLFSFMCRQSAARLLPEFDEATDLADLGVKDASCDDLCASSNRKTVAAPTGRAASKCDAALSPLAARKTEKHLREEGGGSNSFSIITVRGTLKGCLGENGKAAGYLPWSWNMIKLADGKKYLLDLSASMSQLTERFCLAMGAQIGFADEKRSNALQQAIASVVNTIQGNPNQQSQQQQQQSHSGGASHGRRARGATMKGEKGGGGSSSSHHGGSGSAGGSHATASSSSNTNAVTSAAEAQTAALFKEKSAMISSPQPFITPSQTSGPALLLSSKDCEKISQDVKTKPLPPLLPSPTNTSLASTFVSTTTPSFSSSSSTKLSNAISSSSSSEKKTSNLNSGEILPTFSNFADAPLALNIPTNIDAQTASMHCQWLNPGVDPKSMLTSSSGGSGGEGKSENEATTTSSSNIKNKQQSNLASNQQQQQGQNQTQQQQQVGIPTSETAAAISSSPPSVQLLSTTPSSLLIRTFISFFFLTNPQEFAASHFPRQAQHMLLSSKQQHHQHQHQHHQQNVAAAVIPSQGVFKHPFSQGAWESYPRLSHRFFELGLRLKSRARRSMFSIPGPPEFISIEASKNPECIETKLFLYRCSAFNLHGLSTVAPTMNNLYLPMSAQNAQQIHHQIMKEANASASSASGVNTPTTTGAPSHHTTSSGSKSHHGGGSSSHTQQQQQQSPSSNLSTDALAAVLQAKSQMVEKMNIKNKTTSNNYFELITSWIQQQQAHVAKYWSSYGAGGARLNTLPFSQLSRKWTATTCQRSSGVFTHTICVPDVGIYTAVIGVREINPETGRPLQPYFVPAVTYQFSCSFVQSPEPPIAIQCESTIAKLVRPLVSILPANASSSQGIPFFVSPLLPRVRGIAIVNAIEKPKPTAAQQQQEQLRILSQLETLRQQQQQASMQQNASGTPTTTSKSSSGEKKSSSSSLSSKQSKVEQERLQKEQQQQQEELQKQLEALNNNSNESGGINVIERVQVHLLQWDASIACYRGDVSLEPGHCSVWAIVENKNDDTCTSSISCVNTTTSDSSASASSNSIMNLFSTTGINNSSSASGVNNESDNKNSPTTTANVGEKTSSSASHHQRSTKGMSPQEQLALQQQLEEEQRIKQEESDPLRMALTGKDGSIFSKLNPLCLPIDFDSRGMEQMLTAVCPYNSEEEEQKLKNMLSSSSNNNNNNKRNTPGGSRTPSPSPATNTKKSATSSSPAAHGRRNLNKNKKSQTPVENQSLIQAPPTNYKLNTFVTALSTAATEHQFATTSPLTTTTGSSGTVELQTTTTKEEQNAAGENVTPNSSNTTTTNQNSISVIAASASAAATNRLLNTNTTTNKKSDENKKSEANVSVSAVPLWIGISVQRRVQSKDIALVTNNAGYGTILGVSEVALGLHTISSFRATSSTSAAAMQQQSGVGGVTSPNMLSQTQNLISTSSGSGGLQQPVTGLIYPVDLNLEERNAINLSLCGSVHNRVQTPHVKVVGDALHPSFARKTQ